MDVSPTDPLRLWAVGGPGFIARSTDGGASWERVAAPTVAGFEISGLEVVDSNTVFVAGWTGSASRVLRTTTASAAAASGVTWDRDSALPSGGYFNGMSAADASNVWVAPNTPGVAYRSVDGAGSWYSAPIPGLQNQLNDIVAVSATTVVAVGQNGKVRLSTNATATPPTFSSVNVPGEQHHLTAIAAVDASTWTVAGFRGALHRTTNAGASWTRLTSPIQGAPNELDYWDANRMIMGADGRRMAATADAVTWTVRDRGSSVGANLAGVAAIAGTQAVVAVGEEGLIRRSTNLGASYANVTSPVTSHLHAVSSAQLEGRVLFAAGSSGVVIKSTDAGVTWSTTSSTGTSQDLLAIAAADAQVAYAVGRNGTVVRTRNGGSSWQVMPSPAAGVVFAAVGVAGLDTVVIGAWNGNIYRSTDGAATWTTIVPPGPLYEIVSIDVADGTSVIWAGLGYDVALRSLDGGATWSAFSGIGGTLYGIAAASADVAYFSSYNGQLGSTRDGGTTWTKAGVGSNINDIFWDIDAVDTGRAVGVGGRSTGGRVDPGSSITDYDNDNVGADADWVGTSSLFGVCLQAVSGTTTPVWGVDPGGACTVNDSDPWRAVPNGMNKVATTTGVGVAGQVDLVWGMRPAASQASGKYLAHVTIEALAPNA